MTASGQQAALTRLFDHYLHTAAAAMDILRPAERHRRPRIPAPATPGPPMADASAARAWLDAQRAEPGGAAAHAGAHGWPGHAIRLAATSYRYLDTGGHYPEAVAIHGYARSAARRLDDPGAEANALTSLGVIDRRRGRYQQAAEPLQQALALFREAVTGPVKPARWPICWHRLVARPLQQAAEPCGGPGVVPRDRRPNRRSPRAGHPRRHRLRQGRYQQAAGHLQQALDLYRQIGDPPVKPAR